MLIGHENTMTYWVGMGVGQNHGSPIGTRRVDRSAMTHDSNESIAGTGQCELVAINT